MPRLTELDVLLRFFYCFCQPMLSCASFSLSRQSQLCSCSLLTLQWHRTIWSFFSTCMTSWSSKRATRHVIQQTRDNNFVFVAHSISLLRRVKCPQRAALRPRKDLPNRSAVSSTSRSMMTILNGRMKTSSSRASAPPLIAAGTQALQ